MNVTIFNGIPFVWDVETVMRLREQYRIVGSLVGGIPGKNRQNDEHGLPMQLLPEQLSMLVDLGLVTQPTDYTYPNTNHERLRCLAFKHLYDQGCYVTSGLKFGGDFLAYLGDPLCYHAAYVVRCLDSREDVDWVDVACVRRLCGDVNKTVVLFALDDNGQLTLLPVPDSNTSAAASFTTQPML